MEINIKDLEIPQNTYMEDILKEIAEKQSKMFDEKIMETLNDESIFEIFTLCQTELKNRGFSEFRGVKS